MTEEVKTLIIRYLPTIISALGTLISFIILLITKKPKIAIVLNALVEKLPLIINDAESKGFASGEAKLNYVLDISKAYIASQLGISISKAAKYTDLITEQVETILTTPQKKGEN